MPEFTIREKKKKEYEKIACKIDKEYLDKANELVSENQFKTCSEFINSCVRFALENLKIEKSDEENDNEINKKG